MDRRDSRSHSDGQDTLKEIVCTTEWFDSAMEVGMTHALRAARAAPAREETGRLEMGTARLVDHSRNPLPPRSSPLPPRLSRRSPLSRHFPVSRFRLCSLCPSVLRFVRYPDWSAPNRPFDTHPPPKCYPSGPPAPSARPPARPPARQCGQPTPRPLHQARFSRPPQDGQFRRRLRGQPDGQAWAEDSSHLRHVSRVVPSTCGAGS